MNNLIEDIQKFTPVFSSIIALLIILVIDSNCFKRVTKVILISALISVLLLFQLLLLYKSP